MPIPRTTLDPKGTGQPGQLLQELANEAGAMTIGEGGHLHRHRRETPIASPGSLGRKGVVVASGTLGSAAIAIVLSTILARQLGAAGFGTYSVVMATAGLLAAVAGLGLGPLLIRRLTDARHPVSGSTPRSATLEAGIVVGTAVAAVSLAVLSPVTPRVLGALGDLSVEFRPGIIVLMASMAGYGVATEALRGLFRFGPASYLGLPLQRLVVLGTAIAWLTFRPQLLTVERIIEVTAVAATGSLVVAIVWLARTLSSSPPGRVTFDGARRLFAEALPLAGATIVRFGIGKLPIWILAALAGLSDVGVFAFAAAVVAVVALIQVVATKTLAPFVAQMSHNPTNSHLETVLASSAALASALTVIAGAAVVPMLVVAGPKVLGEEYALVPAVFGVLAIRAIIVTYSGSCGLLLSVTGHQNSVAIATGAEATVAAVLLIVASWTLGVLGVAAAVAIASAVGRLLLWNAARRHVGIDTRARFRLLTRNRLLGLVQGP